MAYILGNRRSIHLSYRATSIHFTPSALTTKSHQGPVIGQSNKPHYPSSSFCICASHATYAGNLFNNADALLNHGLSRRFR